MMALEFDENSTVVVRCPDGHITIDYSQSHYDYDDDYGLCDEIVSHPGMQHCGLQLMVITDPVELQTIAEKGGNEVCHKVGDEATYQRMKQLDPEFAAWYQARRGNWWYA